MNEIEEPDISFDGALTAIAKLETRLDDIAHTQEQILEGFQVFAQRLAEFEAERVTHAGEILKDRVAIDGIKSRLARLEKFLDIHPRP